MHKIALLWEIYNIFVVISQNFCYNVKTNKKEGHYGS